MIFLFFKNEGTVTVPIWELGQLWRIKYRGCAKSPQLIN